MSDDAAVAARRHRHGQRDQFADLRIELADLRCAVGNRAVTAHDIGRCLADLLDRGDQLLPILLPIHHHGCRPPISKPVRDEPARSPSPDREATSGPRAVLLCGLARHTLLAPTKCAVPRHVLLGFRATSETAAQAEWCPGAESNHRHGDFQSLLDPLSRVRFALGTSVKHPSRPVKAGTPKHGHARSFANSTAAGDKLAMGPRWMPPSRPTTGR